MKPTIGNFQKPPVTEASRFRLRQQGRYRYTDTDKAIGFAPEQREAAVHRRSLSPIPASV
ncbi:MAG: hypothetical protein LBJ00_13480 [Planctomycetaceae bacterium]|nr:hypothetical protein [Planctomycetaceae bacterium]